MNFTDPSGENSEEVAKGYLGGLWNGGKNFVQGVVDFAKNPVGTLMNVSVAVAVVVSNPGASASAILETASATLDTFINATDYEAGYMIGTAVGEAAVGGAVAKGLGAVGVVQKAVKITFGHGARHLDGTGLSIEEVEATIGKDAKNFMEGSSEQSWYGQVTVDDKVIEYRAQVREDNGTLNIGTYYLKK